MWKRHLDPFISKLSFDNNLLDQFWVNLFLLDLKFFQSSDLVWKISSDIIFAEANSQFCTKRLNKAFSMIFDAPEICPFPRPSRFSNALAKRSRLFGISCKDRSLIPLEP